MVSSSSFRRRGWIGSIFQARGRSSGGAMGSPSPGSIDLNRLAVEVRIGKMIGGFAEVHEREVVLFVSSWTRVPRPMICLNSVMEPIRGRAR